jgi:hypothetical protein
VPPGKRRPAAGQCTPMVPPLPPTHGRSAPAAAMPTIRCSGIATAAVVAVVGDPGCPCHCPLLLLLAVRVLRPRSGVWSSAYNTALLFGDLWQHLLLLVAAAVRKGDSALSAPALPDPPLQYGHPTHLGSKTLTSCRFLPWKSCQLTDRWTRLPCRSGCLRIDRVRLGPGSCSLAVSRSAALCSTSSWLSSASSEPPAASAAGRSSTHAAIPSESCGASVSQATWAPSI